MSITRTRARGLGRGYGALTDPRIVIGAVLTLFVVGLAVLGPYVAPYG